MLADEKPPAQAPRSLPVLTQTQERVLAVLVQGFANKAIAGHLGLSSRTVEIHLREIIRRFSARNRVHAATLAVQYGMVDEVKPVEGK
jgi:DNA-binding NarL/FixJ family response regulator